LATPSTSDLSSLSISFTLNDLNRTVVLGLICSLTGTVTFVFKDVVSLSPFLLVTVTAQLSSPVLLHLTCAWK
jgi:hypothetical protein